MSELVTAGPSLVPPWSRHGPVGSGLNSRLHSRLQALRRKRYHSLSPADCHSWPALARGLNTVVVSHGADQPISYLAPILTNILLNSIFTLHTSSTGVSGFVCATPTFCLFWIRALLCLRPARCGAAVSRLGEGPGGLRPAGGHERRPNPPPRHRAARRRPRRGQGRQDPQKL